MYKEGTKIYPNEYITKREFVKMAERFFTINLCELKDGGNSDFASDIHVVDKTSACSVNSPATTFPNTSENTYSFIPEVSTTASGYTYEWEFVNSDTKEKKTETSQNLCSYTLPSSGIWIVKLTVRDKNGNTSISYSQVSVTSSSASKTPLSVDISAKPLVSPIGIAVGFDSKISGGVGPYEYRWSFGDGDLAKTSTSTHTYSEKGVYTVTLVVTDSQGNHAYSSLNVEVYENADIDGDGILNNEDLCPTVYGIKELAGCPRVDEFSVDTPGSSFLSANAIGNVCLSSLAFDSGALFGKSACTSCPCEYSLDFNAALRRCDIVFPTILSPDKKTIYSRGKIYEIPAK